MTEDTSRTPILATGPFLSISGSVASLVALAMVFVEKVASSHQIDPQFMLWRLTLCVASLVSIGTTLTLLYHRIRGLDSVPQLSATRRTLRAGVLTTIGVLATGLFSELLLVSLYWTWWLPNLPTIVHTSQTKPSPTLDSAEMVAAKAVARKSIAGRTVSIFFGEERSADALHAKSALEEVGGSVRLVPDKPGAIQPNIVYFRNVNMLGAALEIEKVLLSRAAQTD